MTGSNVTDSLSLALGFYSYQHLVCLRRSRGRAVPAAGTELASPLPGLLIWAEKLGLILLLFSLPTPVHTSGAKAEPQIVTGQDRNKLAAKEMYRVSNPSKKH